jgi:hypothetical protein
MDKGSKTLEVKQNKLKRTLETQVSYVNTKH